MAQKVAAIGLSLSLAAVPFSTGRAYDEGPEPPPISRTQPYTYYASMVAGLLPPYTPSMLSVLPGPDWMAGTSVQRVATAVGDDVPGTIVSDGSITVGYDEPDGPRYIKLDFGRGFVRYLNRDRSFQDSSPCMATPESQAYGMFQSVVTALSIPSQELGVITVNTVMERSVDGEDPDLPESVCEIERTVTQARQLTNGHPVFDSYVRGAVSNLGTHARLLVDWPPFALEEGLLMRERSEVIDDLAQRIWRAVKNESDLGPEIELHIELGYAKSAAGFVPVARGGYADTFDAEAGQIEDVPLALNPVSGVFQQQHPATIQFRVRFEAGNGIAVIDFYLPNPSPVQLLVFDACGREIRMITDSSYPAGWHQAHWDLRDSQSRRVAAGVYFATLRTGRASPSEKVIVVRSGR